MSTEECLLLEAFLTSSDLGLLIHADIQMRTSWNDVAPTMCLDAAQMLTTPNAGGASRISESLAMDVLARTLSAKLTQSEVTLRYWPTVGPITDFSVELHNGAALGVSVTRACGTAGRAPWDSDAAARLLRKKLGGVLESTRRCLNGGFAKQLLFVWSRGAAVAAEVERAYSELPPELRANTVVLVAESSLAALYEEKAVVERAPRMRRGALKGLKDASHLSVLRENEAGMSLAAATRGSDAMADALGARSALPIVRTC